MKSAKTAWKFKVFGLKKCPQKFEKGIACGYRTQKVPRISPDRSDTLFWNSIFDFEQVKGG